MIPFLLILTFSGFLAVFSSPASAQENSSPGIIQFYQKYISPVDGDRCPMYPSCSEYFKQSIEKHGIAAGWIMGMDRLVRCGRDEVDLSRSVRINGEKHTYDPVENNDFWWSDK